MTALLSLANSQPVCNELDIAALQCGVAECFTLARVVSSLRRDASGPLCWLFICLGRGGAEERAGRAAWLASARAAERVVPV